MPDRRNVIQLNNAPVAQWIEHQPSKLLVVSSNLAGGARCRGDIRLHILDMGVYVFLVQDCIPVVELTQWNCWTEKTEWTECTLSFFFIVQFLLTEH